MSVVVIRNLYVKAVCFLWIALGSCLMALSSCSSGNDKTNCIALENLLDEIKDDERFRPDLVVYIGGHIVSKKLKSYLRSLKGVEQIRISQEADIEDTFMHLTKVMDLPNS